MNELQVWACSCGAERTWGIRHKRSEQAQEAWLACENCRRQTKHRFTGKYRPHQFVQFRVVEKELDRTLKPATFWKQDGRGAHRKQNGSPNYGFSNAGRR